MASRCMEGMHLQRIIKRKICLPPLKNNKTAQIRMHIMTIGNKRVPFNYNVCYISTQCARRRLESI
jgi:hypothetical protein